MKNNTKFAASGWFVAAALFGIVVGSGFQGSAEKYGVVDIRQVILDSKINQEMTDRVEASRKARLAILEFIDQQRVVTDAQARRIRELELKDNKTDAERTELTGIKDAVVAAAKDYARINAKSGDSLTEADRQLLLEYGALFKDSVKILNTWSQEFDSQYSQIRDTAEREAIQRAQAAAVAVAKKQGFSVVFSSTAVIFAANDLTADVTKEANK